MSHLKLFLVFGITLTFLCLSIVMTQADAADNRALKRAKVETTDTNDKRIALVIGNSTYSSVPLKNPVNDANDVANKLRRLGFEVIERSNLKIKQIGGTLREFKSKLTPGAVALVFYAGHGLQIKADNYLPAVDAEINSEEDVPNQSLSVKQIMDVLDEARTRLNLVFLDACRDNPYASRSFRSMDRGLARVSAPSGTLISYATKPGSVAQDGDGRNGLYTSKLLSQMNSNKQIELALKHVVSEVKAASHGKQEPWMEGSIEGDFCFAGCNNVAPAIAAGNGEPQPNSNLNYSEIALWEEVKKENTVGDYQAYLTKYPQGQYAVLAQGRIEKIKRDTPEEKQRKEVEPGRRLAESEQRNSSPQIIASYSQIAPAKAYSGMHEREITGAGATFPYPIYAKWAENYKAKTGVSLNYQSIGSGGGIKQITARTVNFGASDKPLTSAELAAGGGLVQFPTVIGGVVPVINVEGVQPGQLKLTGETLAGIFLGRITHWNDPEITANNRGLSLPDTNITVIHRSDGNGQTFNFTNYLSQVSAEWRSGVGADTAVAWPTGMGGRGNEGVAANVKSIRNSIGYVEYAYMKQNRMTYVQLKNLDGQFVNPLDVNLKAAAANTRWSSDDFFQILTNQPGSDSWPICGATFILMHSKENLATSAKEALMFFDWAYSNGGSLAEDLDYVPLPGNVIQLIRNSWSSKIKDSDGRSIW
jgi:phosphate transport system substrate-binding protein